MHQCNSEVLLALVVLVLCTCCLVRATPVPPLASPTTSPPLDEAASFATELLEPGEAVDEQGTLPVDLLVEYDAKKFLQNYGYMPVYNPAKSKWEFTDRSKSSRKDAGVVTPTTPAGDGEDAAGGAGTEKVPSKTNAENDSFKAEEQSKFEQAIESFQRRYKLHVTRSIDDQTLRFMQQPRCGVADYTRKADGQVELASAEAKSGKMAIGKSTSKAAISNESGAIGGTLKTKLASVSGGRSTVSSPVAKLPTRTQDSSQLSSEDAKASESISLSGLILEPSKPKPDAVTSVGSTQKSTDRTTELTEIVTDVVTVRDEELSPTAASAPTTAPTTAGTNPLQSKEDIPRIRRSAAGTLHGLRKGDVRRRRRTKREYTYDGNTTGSPYTFNKEVITWRILSSYYSRHFSAESQRSQIAQAFRRWAEFLPLRFEEMPTGDILNVDIQVAFVDNTNRDHFDINLGDEQLALTTNARSIYFNDDIQWTYNSLLGKNLIKVAVHEVGHVLGLDHDDDNTTVMYPVYSSPPSNYRTPIDDASRQDAQAIHGVCDGSFDTILDWVRTVGTRRRYSSVFFRGDTMWVYENANRQVKYGDPRRISDMWSGVPSNLDAALQILPRSSTVDTLYFFKGNKYYQYDNVNRRVMTTDPVTNEDISNGKLISEGWPGKPGYPSIPDNIDTAYYDKRDGNVYFFKGSQVYAYDMQADGCCLENYPKSISTAYPYRYASGGLPSNIDAAYYSIHSRRIYFFKGNTFWENETYLPSASTVANKVGFSQQWNQRWQNICEA